LAEAVNGWFAGREAAPPVPLRLSAAGAGQVRVALEGRARTLIRDLADRPDQGLDLPWGAPGVGRMRLGAGAQLLEAACLPVAQLLPQHIHLAPESSAHTGRAQRCSPRMAAAQGFAPLPPGAALTGLDLLARSRTAAGAGTLALHPDQHGRPAPAPFGGAVLPLAWADQTPGGAGPIWIGADLPTPLTLPEGPWWLVLALTAGELLWSLGSDSPPGAAACRYRSPDGVWLPPTAAGPAAWALTRLRTAGSTAPGSMIPSSLIRVRLRRGTAEVPWPVDAGGRLRAAAADLAPLNGVTDETLEVIIEAQSAGRVRLTDLRVAWR
jgi:hypothetical protein